ncbi:hypothetical protein Q9966_007222 [Columba livia]|nr:hypothetical protein Q9966_007222 [Columba livia]
MVLQGGIQSSRDRGVGTGCQRGQLFWSSRVKAEHCQSLKDEEEMESLGKLELWFAQVALNFDADLLCLDPDGISCGLMS